MALSGANTRPADVLLQAMLRRPVAVDAVVSHTLRHSNDNATRDCPSATATRAEAAKATAQERACLEAGWDFVPFGMEATGALGKCANKLVKQLSSTASYLCGRG